MIQDESGIGTIIILAEIALFFLGRLPMFYDINTVTMRTFNRKPDSHRKHNQISDSDVT